MQNTYTTNSKTVAAAMARVPMAQALESAVTAAEMVAKNAMARRLHGSNMSHCLKLPKQPREKSR